MTTEVPDADARPGADAEVGSAMDADAQSSDADVCVPQLTSPASGTHTNGTVMLVVKIPQGCPQPASVAVRANTTTVATLTPPFQGDWNTTTTPEGTYFLTAGDKSSGTSGPTTVVVDRTKPTVMKVSPAANAVGVSLAAPIEIVFSEPMLPSTLPSTAVSIVSNAMAVPNFGSLSADGKTLTVNITDRSKLDLPATIGAGIPLTATDLAGNSLGVQYTWMWTAPAWITPDSLAADKPPVLALAPDGRPTIAYAVLEGGATQSYNLHVALASGKNWTQLPSPSSDLDTGAAGYSLVLDGMGRPTIAWSEPGAGSRFIRVRSWDGTAWQAPSPQVDALAGGATDAVAPRVKLDPMNRPVVAWLETRTDRTLGIYLARWNGTVWEKPFGDTGISNRVAYDLALDAAGNPILSHYSGGGFEAGVTAWNGTTWSPSPALTSEDIVANLALDGSGAPMVVTLGTSVEVQKLSAGAWSVVGVAVPATPTAISPKIAATTDGRPIVSWIDLASGKYGLARWNGKLWDVRFGLFSAGMTVDEPPAVAVDPKNNVWAAWLEKGRAYVWMSNY